MKKGLLIDGTIESDLNKTRLDYVKLMLLIPKGSVLGKPDLGYSNKKYYDEDNLRSSIDSILSKLENNNLSVDKINYNGSSVTIYFKGTDLNIVL